MARPTVSLIAAVDRSGGIGKDNALLVRLPEDLAHFKRTTLGSPVVMGRRTWDSIGRALPGRRNIVVTRNAEFGAPGAECAASLPDALALLGATAKIYVIGGASIYAAALPFADELVLTEIEAEFGADTFFPVWDRSLFTEICRVSHATAGGLRFSFVTWRRNAATDGSN